MLSTALIAVTLVPVLVAGLAGQTVGRGAEVVPSETQKPAAPLPDRGTEPTPVLVVPTAKDPHARVVAKLIIAKQMIAPQSAAKPKVLCGLTVVEVDPDIDPKIIVRPKPDDVDHKIRRIPPSVCRE
jgi:hypothetical protein